MSARQTQREAVLRLLADGRLHTSREFVELGVLRAAARVLELRQRGWPIECERVERASGAVYAYRLAGQHALDVELEREPAPPAAVPEVEVEVEPEPEVELPDQLELAGDVAEPGCDEQPSLKERRRIAAAAREAFARSLSGAA